jgi:rhomboid protease GluP
VATCKQCGRKLPPLSFRKICEWCLRHEAAQRGEEPEDAIQPVMSVPWAGGETGAMVTQGLLVLNLVAYVAVAIAGNAVEPTTRHLVASGANYAPLTLGGEPWRLLTSMFLHGGLFHILINMWCLWNLGGLCEGLYGHATFAAVYLITGLASSLASVWWHPAVPSVGASGAIFGIVGALIASYFLGEFSLPRFAIQSHLRSLVFFVGYSFILGPLFGRVDNAAHIGGLVSGLLFGALIARVAPGRGLFPRIAVVFAVSLAVLGCGSWLYRSRSYLIHYQRGMSSLQQGRMDQVLEELQTTVRQRPEFAHAHLALAQVHYIKNQLPQAEEEFKKAIALDPSDKYPRFQLAAVFLGQAKTAQAKDAYQQILALDGNDASAHMALGVILASENNHAAAVEEYKRAAQLGPDLGGVHYRRGLSEAALKNYDEAIAGFLKQREVGDDSENERALADAYRAKGMKPQAEEALKKAEELKAQEAKTSD